MDKKPISKMDPEEMLQYFEDVLDSLLEYIEYHQFGSQLCAAIRDVEASIRFLDNAKHGEQWNTARGFVIVAHHCLTHIMHHEHGDAAKGMIEKLRSNLKQRKNMVDGD